MLLSQAGPAGAVLFYATANPTYNTNTPTKTYTNSGWQYVGHWSIFTGTVIASNYFITAKHVGGALGDPFLFRGTNYPAIAVYEDPASDLAIWRVAGTLAPVAPLYTKPNERNKPLVVIGRGTPRGAEVRVKKVLKGWQWGDYDGVQRWGRNIVSSIVPAGNGNGDLLRVTFDARVPGESHLSVGDSGGPLFIKDGRVWELAGINSGVDGPFNTTGSGDGFKAAIFDARGLYVETASGWMLLQGPRPIPSAFYATRISSRTNWINRILTQP